MRTAQTHQLETGEVLARMVIYSEEASYPSSRSARSRPVRFMINCGCETRDLLNYFGERNDGFVHDHPGHGLAVCLFLGSIDAMRFGVDGKAVNFWLHVKVP